MTIKKSITVNIAQTLIRIDEDAYEALQTYLTSVEAYFADTDDANEIVKDIEARIAELLTEKTTDSHPSISVDDVRGVITAMGTPDDFAGTHDTAAGSTETAGGSARAGGSGSARPPQRRLFRDEENGVIAGVCAGIATYLGIDVVFIRILFLLLIFVNGFGILLYVICWIAIPKAVTVADKMQMQGEAVTLESIKARAEAFASSEEAKRAQEKITTGARQFASSVQDAGQRFGKNVEGIAQSSGSVFWRTLTTICVIVAIVFIFFIIIV